MSVKSKVGSYKERVERGIQLLKQDPLSGLAELIPLLMRVIFIVAFAVAFIKFISDGTYGKQMDLVSDKDNNYWDAFTWGTLPVMFHSWTLSVIGCLMAVETLLMLIAFFRFETKSKKRLLIISAIAFSAGLLAYASLYVLINFVAKETLKIIAIVIIAVSFIAAVTFGIVLIIAKTNQIMLATLIEIGIGFGVLPALLAFLENIIPLFILAVAVLVFGIILKIFVSKDGGGGGSSYKPSRAKDEEKTGKEEKPQGRVVRYASSCKVFFHQEVTGAYVYVCDYAGLYATQDKPELMTKILYSDFKSGKIIIEVGYKRVQESDLIKSHFPY